MSEIQVPDPNPHTKEAASDLLKKEIDLLSKQQSEARRTATYGGMTPDEAKEYDLRRKTILNLTETLLRIEKHE